MVLGFIFYIWDLFCWGVLLGMGVDVGLVGEWRLFLLMWVYSNYNIYCFVIDLLCDVK